MKFCISCGQKLAASYKFCGNCGTKIQHQQAVRYVALLSEMSSNNEYLTGTFIDELKRANKLEDGWYAQYASPSVKQLFAGEDYLGIKPEHDHIGRELGENRMPVIRQLMLIGYLLWIGDTLREAGTLDTNFRDIEPDYLRAGIIDSSADYTMPYGIGLLVVGDISKGVQAYLYKRLPALAAEEEQVSQFIFTHIIFGILLAAIENLNIRGQAFASQIGDM
jgi:hypothetical protein